MADPFVLGSLILITFGMSLATQLINYKLIDQKQMRNHKKRLKEIQSQIRKVKDPKKITKMQTELMNINSKMMKLSFKPLMITIAPLWIMFFILQSIYTPYGDLISLPINLPLFGSAISWLGTYIIFSLLFSLLLKPLITRIGDKYAKTK
jgi:uncharacterized membrane protein (DUF106 family)